MRTTFAALAVPLLMLGSSPAPGGLDRVPLNKVLEAAARIDTLVEQGLKTAGQKPNALVDDATFVRRAYLDIVGRIPTGAETRAFLEGKETGKRSALIDRLLASPGNESHAFNYWADVLRTRTRLAAQTSGEPYIDWLKTTLAENKPYDAMVRELLTSEGAAHKRGEGATGYYLRDRGMPEDNMSNTVRVFLGTRLECAQCHDHPFDTWTQKQYFEMVAFTGGIEYQDRSGMESPEGRRLRELVESKKGADKKKEDLTYRAMRNILQPLGQGIDGSGTGLARLPDDYKYEDGKPNETIKAKTMFGDPVALEYPAAPSRQKPAKDKTPRRGGGGGVEIGSRAAYADWMTSPKNPRFTLVIANRMWKRVMGFGLIEPYDDMKADSKAVNPPLMDNLTALMVELKYDLKQFQRVLYNTKAYQRAAVAEEPMPGEPFHFPGPLLRRMTAEQMWDSLLTLVIPDLDGTLAGPGGPRAEQVYDQYDHLIAITEEELVKRSEVEALRYSDPAKYREARKEMMKNDEAMRQKSGKRDRGNSGGTLVRASDLQSPAPPNHLLHEFGQSERELIETAHQDPAVTQVLTMMNGFLDRYLMPRKDGALRAELLKAGTPEDRIKVAYLGILNRPPTAKETSLWKADVEKIGEAAYADLVWTLVNMHEFMFVR